MSDETIVQSNQFLTFSLDGELFGLNVLRVKEILELCKITKVPQTSEYLLGVINLRGNAVPVIDLRKKFKMDDCDTTVNTCIIDVEVEFNGESTIFGILVDAVKEVIDLEKDEILPKPKIGLKVDNEFIQGMGRKGEDFIILLDIDKVLSVDELEFVKETQKSKNVVEGALEVE